MTVLQNPLQSLLQPVLRPPFGLSGDPLSAYAVDGLNPTLVHDWVSQFFYAAEASRTFSETFTFARTGTATFIDSVGALQTAASGVAREQHHAYVGGQLVSKGLLFESESRTNDFLQSESLTTGWSTTRASVSAEGDAFKITQAAGQTNAGGIFRSVIGGGLTRTVSIEAKAAEKSWLFIIHSGGGNNVWFDLSAGVVGTQNSAAFTGQIEDMGDGWYRCSSTGIESTGNTVFYCADNDGTSVVTDSGGILVRRPQNEAGLVPSSYIPTTTTTQTRAAESLAADASLLPSSTTAQSGSFKGRLSYADLNTVGQITLYDRRADANNRITITLDTDGAKSGTVTLTMVNGGVSATVSEAGIQPSKGALFNIAWRASDTDINIAVNGVVAVATSTAIGVPDLSTADASYGGIWIDGLERGWDGVALTDAQLAEASNINSRVSLTSAAFLNSGIIDNSLNQPPAVKEGVSASDQVIRENGNILYEPADTGREYKTFYSGLLSATEERIHYAYSSDGVNWTKFSGNPVITATREEDPYVVKDGATYHMYNEAKGRPGSWISHFTSTDCETWTDVGIIQDTATSAEFANSASPVVWIEDGVWYMLYEDFVDSPSLSLATSIDGHNWTNSANNPVLEPDDLAWANGAIVPNDIIKKNGVYYLTFHDTSSPNNAGIATSTDLISWTDHPCNPIRHKSPYAASDTPIHIQLIPQKNGDSVTDLLLYYSDNSDGLVLGYTATE